MSPFRRDDVHVVSATGFTNDKLIIMYKNSESETESHPKTEQTAQENIQQLDLTKEQVDTIISERGLVFIDPLSDFGFKRLLGTERNKEITIHLLNTLIGDDTGLITDITFIESEMVGFLPGKRKVRLDIHCKTQNSDHVIIEMQREGQRYFVRRLRVYSSHSTVSSVKMGDEIYASVPNVFSLCFMEKDMAEFKGRDRFFWKVYQKDDDNVIFSKENVLYFAELCKFAAHLETLDLTDEKNLWLYMLTHVADIGEEELRRMDPIFQQFYNECLISNLNDMEKKEYVTSVLEYADVKESLMCEREEGREEGVLIGIEQGIELGREQGREEGREETKCLLARNMLAEGFAPAVVAKITGLTEEEVLSLQ